MLSLPDFVLREDGFSGLDPLNAAVKQSMKGSYPQKVGVVVGFYRDLILGRRCTQH